MLSFNLSENNEHRNRLPTRNPATTTHHTTRQPRLMTSELEHPKLDAVFPCIQTSSAIFKHDIESSTSNALAHQSKPLTLGHTIPSANVDAGVVAVCRTSYPPTLLSSLLAPSATQAYYHPPPLYLPPPPKRHPTCQILLQILIFLNDISVYAVSTIAHIYSDFDRLFTSGFARGVSTEGSGTLGW
ncbi:hypothetical protein BDQ17DRAFT_1542947 [Cyathus striatus]|nr:hypothetical protein BDQ17DRAFT_1542947 [Cyathus striatus]